MNVIETYPAAVWRSLSTAAAVLLGVAVLANGPVRAQDPVPPADPSAAVGDGMREIAAREGDTSLTIARREFGSAAYARPLAELNGLETDSVLAAGAPFRIPLDAPANLQTARVAFVKGDVTRAGEPLENDQTLAEGDVVVTGVDGFISIEFATGSVVNLQPNTRATIARLSCLESDPSCEIEIVTDRGELSSDVEPRDGQPIEFRISTPFASAAVRGTRFETMVGEETLRAAVTEGRIDVEAIGESVEVPSGFGSVTRRGEPPGDPFPLLRSPVFRSVPTRVAAGDVVTWFDLPTAIAYTVLLSRDEAGVETVAEPSVVATQLRITPEFESGDFFVTLRGVDTNDVPGSRSTVRIAVADIDADIDPVETTISREGSEYLIAIVDPPADAPGFEIQVSTSEDFSDPLSLDVANAGQAVLGGIDSDTLYARARTLIDPLTVSAFGPASGNEP